MTSMILNDYEILKEQEAKNIVIRPFNMESLGSNSYDVHLGKILASYDETVLDVKKHNKITYLEIPEDGYLLHPGQLYLGVTQEYTETHKHVPFIDGKSSLARLGLQIHSTSHWGNIGFCNHWTLEISCIHPVRIYTGMPIGKICYLMINSENIQSTYHTDPHSKYTEVNDKPTESMMWKNFPPFTNKPRRSSRIADQADKKVN